MSSVTASESAFQDRVEEFVRSCGMRSFIRVRVLIGTQAYAVGFTGFGMAFGVIALGKDLIAMLSPAEVDFVLAHETTHILRNHSFARLARTLPLEIAKAFEETRDAARALKLAFDIFALYSQLTGTTPIRAEMLRAEEYEADFIGAQLSGNLEAACSGLMKLVANDPAAPSHTWEVFGQTFPAMSVGERVAALRDMMDRLCRLRLWQQQWQQQQAYHQAFAGPPTSSW